MNEELKIIITAVTSSAKKGIKEVNGEVQKLSASGKNSSKSFGESMKAIGKGATIAVAAVVAAVTAIVAALTKLGKTSLELSTKFGKLTTAFQASGSSAQQAATTYKELYSFLGDSDKAVEAGSHLAKLTTNEKELAEWATICQGVYASFGDSLPIEGLTEAANETARVGKVTGVVADALNWAGENEDVFNAKLAECTSLQEREVLIRNTLNGLYSDAARLYEKNNQSIIQYNESQAELDMTLASFKESLIPMLTALNNLSNTLLQALAPAINAVASALTFLINKISEAIKWISSFFGALTGKSMDSVGGSFASASGSVGGYTSSLEGATEAAKELKRATMGFDELNVVSSQSSSSSASGSSSGVGASTGASSAVSFDDTAFGKSLEKGSKSAEDFAKKVKTVFNDLKIKVKEWMKLFNPTVEAWRTSFSNLSTSWDGIKSNIGNGLIILKDTFLGVATYLLEDFVPSIVNSFGTNIVPIYLDVLPFAFEEASKSFEFMAQTMQTVTDDVIYPVMNGVKTLVEDVTGSVKEDWDQSGEDILTGLSGLYESLRGLWNQIYNEIFLPIWNNVVEGVSELWNNHLKPLWDNLVDFISSLVDCVLVLWNNVLAPFVSWIISFFAPPIINAFQTIWEFVLWVFSVVSDVIGGLLKSLTGLLDFITGVFSGDWEKAWSGICDFFGGIWEAIWGIVKGAINLIIWALNGIWRAIYSVVAGIINGIGGIAKAIGGLLGQDWGFSMPAEPPTIPYLAKGGVVVGETLAKIGEGGKKEAVLPLEQNTEWMDILAERISLKNGTPSKIVLMLDKKQLGEATISSINDITRATGKLQLAVM